MRHLRYASALFGSIWFGLSQSAIAQDKGPDLACIDRAGNRNGKIDTPEEILTLALHQDQTFREQDKNCDGEITKAEIDTWSVEKKNTLRVRLAIRDITRRVEAGTPPKIESKKEPKDGGPSAPTGEKATWIMAQGSGQFYLRKDFQDFHVFSSPKAQGAGADFSGTWDRIANNRAVAAKGVAFVPFIFDSVWDESQRDQPYIGSIALAPSLRFEYVSNSNPQLKKKNIEILTPGATAEVELANILGWTHYVRTRASIVTTEGRADNWQIHNEWQPIQPSGALCIGTPCALLASPLLFRFDPVLVGEYSEIMDNSDLASLPLFMDRRRAFLVGPALALKVYPNGLRRDELPLWLQYAELTTNYNWYQDVISRRHYSMFETALTFRLDKDNHLGVTLKYSRGNVQDTAQRKDLATAGLSVKF